MLLEHDIAALRAYQQALAADPIHASQGWVARAWRIREWNDTWAADALDQTLTALGERDRPAQLLAGAILRLMRKDVAGAASLLDQLSGLETAAPEILDSVRRQIAFEHGERASLMRRGGNFRGLDLTGVVMDGGNLQRAKFIDAILSSVSFLGADLTGADLSGTRLAWWQLSGADATSASFVGATITNDRYYDFGGLPPRRDPPILTRASFNRAHLVAPRFIKASMRGATFVGSQIDTGVFDGAELADADLSEATIVHLQGRGAKMRGIRAQRARFVEGSLEQAQIGAANLEESSFTKSQLSRAGLQRARLSKAEFQGVDMSGADLSYATGSNVRFVDAALRQTAWVEASLPDASFRRGDMRGANFTNAMLAGSEFRDISLEGASFFGADLRRVTFFGSVNVSGVDFRGTDLRGAYLGGIDRKSINLSTHPHMWNGAVYDQSTYWPEGLDPSKLGAVMQ